MVVIWNLTLSFICVLVFPVFLSDDTLSFSNSLFPVMLWAALFMLLRYAKRQDYSRRMLKFTHVLGFVFSSLTMCGCALEKQGTVSFRSLGFLFTVLLYAHVFALLLSALWTCFENLDIFLQEREMKSKEGTLHRAFVWIFEHPAAIAVFLLFCWLPCYIASFPGGFCYDATPEFEQCLEGKGYNENFPMLHSVLITRILSAGYKLTGSYNTGIAFYAAVQMLLVAVMFTHILHTFYKRRVSGVLLVGCLLYGALFPVVPMLVTHTVRDVLFSALLTYTMFLFYLYSCKKTSFMHFVINPFFLGLMFVLTMLSRNNNTGAVMVVIIVSVSAFVWIANRKANLRGACIFAATACGGYLLLSAGLLALCQPRLYLNTQRSSLSMFAQCIARAYMMEGDNWSEEEEKALGDYFKMEDFRYVAENADPAKTSVHFEDGKTLKDFIFYWGKIGLKHPGCYLDAILSNSKQMWFPGSIVDGYKKVGGYEEYDKCYFFFGRVDKPGTHRQFLPGIWNFYTKIGLYLSFEKIPIISMLFSIGFQVWVLLNCAFYIAYRKYRQLYLPVAILLGYTVISAFVPLVLLRYFCALFFALPMTVVFTLQPTRAIGTDSAPAA